MVTAAASPSFRSAALSLQEFNWATTSLESVFKGGLRLDASVYATEAQTAKALVTQCKFGFVLLSELALECTYPGRFKRAYVAKQYGEKFFLPSQLNELAPEATKFLALKKTVDVNALRVKENSLLITRSGTIGSCTIASKTLAGGIFSDDVLRFVPNQEHNLGYVFTYLKSRHGRAVLQSAMFAK